LKIEEEIKQPIFVRNVKDYSTLENGTVNIIDDDLNEILYDCINKKIVPKVKCSSLSTVSQITMKENDKNIILVNPGDKRINVEITKKICEKAGIMFNNQSIGTLLADLQKHFFKPIREVISKETRREIFNEQCGKCADCNEDLGDKYELDHIQPLSGGGTNDRDNLEFLCKACHVEKSKEEHAEYIKRDEISSSLNLQAAEILDSKLSKKVAFCHHLAEYFNEDELQSIDIIKDRRNLAMYSGYNFCKYSVLDNWEPFDGEVEDGHYYIETDNYELFHKNGIYSRPIVDHGLAEEIITLKNIEQQFKPSSVISSDYFQNFIHYLDEMFKESGEEKLAVNSWIGLLGRRHCSHI
jgi:hypothetical protein